MKKIFITFIIFCMYCTNLTGCSNNSQNHTPQTQRSIQETTTTIETTVPIPKCNFTTEMPNEIWAGDVKIHILDYNVNAVDYDNDGEFYFKLDFKAEVLEKKYKRSDIELIYYKLIDNEGFEKTDDTFLESLNYNNVSVGAKLKFENIYLFGGQHVANSDNTYKLIFYSKN